MDIAHDGRAALGEGGFALGVAGEVTVKLGLRGDAINADVDDGCARLNHLCGDETGAANGGDENVCLARHRRQVARLRVADGDRGVS